MTTKGKAVVSITAIIKAAAAAKAEPVKVETYRDGETYVQYVVTAPESDTYRFVPTRHWVSVTAADDSVICYKNLGSVIAATAQASQGFTDKGIAPESLESKATVLGFGVHNRIFEVKATPQITKLLAAVASFDGEEHVFTFKAKTAASKATRKLYRKVERETLAELTAIAALD